MAENMCSRCKKNISTLSSTLGEWHIFGCACLKHKCQQNLSRVAWFAAVTECTIRYTWQDLSHIIYKLQVTWCMLHADVLNQAARQSVTASHSPQWQHNRPCCNLKFSLVPMVLRRISHYPHEVSQYPHCPMDSLSPNLSSPKFHRMHFLRGCTPQESLPSPGTTQIKLF